MGRSQGRSRGFVARVSWLTATCALLALGCPSDPPGPDDDTTPVDADGDGFSPPEDCDDGDPDTYPDAEELCDDLDNDCDGEIDDDLPDGDGDGFADCVDPTPDGFDGGEGREAPLSVQLHLHGSLSEADATMMWHTAQAELYGVDVLWWSDHDNMILMCTRSGGYDFDGGAFTEEIERVGLQATHGVYLVGDDLASLDSSLLPGGPSGTGHHWRLSGAAPQGDPDWHLAQFEYGVAEPDSFQRLPMMAGVTGSLAIRTQQPLSEGWQLRFTVGLGGNMAGTRNGITYYLSGVDLSAASTEHHQFVPLSVPWEGIWTELELPLTATAETLAEGDDQSGLEYAFELWLRNGTTATVDIDDLSFSWSREGEALRDYQNQVLVERYSDGPVVHYVGQEITLVEGKRHVNPVGAEPVPLVDYWTTGEITFEDATAHVRDHGALALCNHPFGSATVIEYEDADADLQVELLAEEWISADVHGCDLVEVGYRARVLDLTHLLRFWDRLAGAGYPLTGVGTNDHHWASDWIDSPNPFQTWVFLDQASRGDIADQLGAGRAFFGDPGPFVGQEPLLDLWTEHGAVMGQVLATELDQVLHVETGYVEPGWSLRLVVDGDEAETRMLDGDETDTVFELPRGAVGMVRVELLDLDGVQVLLSNPLYLVWTEDEVPPRRRP